MTHWEGLLNQRRELVEMLKRADAIIGLYMAMDQPTLSSEELLRDIRWWLKDNNQTERSELLVENGQLKGIIRELLREASDVPGDLRYRATAVLAGGDTPSETTSG